MNRCDRTTASSADCSTATEKVVKDKMVSGGGGARPRARQPPKTGNGKTWTSSAKRGGEGKFAKCSVASAASPGPPRSDKSGAFDSLLKRAQRRRSSGNTSEKAVGKHGTRGDVADDIDCGRPVDLGDTSDDSKKPKEHVEQQSAREDIPHDSTCYDSVENKKPAADPVEYTILPRPERQRAAAAESQLISPSQGTSCEEENVLLAPRDAHTPSRDLRFRERTRRCPVASYADASGAFVPQWPSPEKGFYPADCRRPTFAPASRSAPGCIADELNCLKLAEVAVHPSMHYPEVYHPLPPPPLVPPPVVPPPFQGFGYFADRVSRRRTRSFPRRLPERRLYDAHGRWVGQERRSLQDFDEEGWSLSLQHQPCRDGFCSYAGGGRELQRSPCDVLPRGYNRRHSWSHPSVLHDDDIEDLLPLIDKLAVDYANSDSSSAEGAAPEAAAHIPDEGSWFSVLPETTRPEDRFIWSPRRDLHRPRSVWSPIKPRLGGSQQDGLRDSLTRAKYRFRTYTENVFQASVDAIVEGRRSVSCELPYLDDDASSFAANGGETHCSGWSPWSSQLPTADLLNVS